jgi:hypothetical protein
MKKCLLLALVAGSACTAMGQVKVPLLEQPEVRYINAEGVSGGSYGNRAIGTVWNSTTPACAAYLNGASKIFVTNIDFAPGPWATTTNNIQTTVAIWSFGENSGPYRINVRYFDTPIDLVTATPNIIGGTLAAPTLNGQADITGTGWAVNLPSHGNVIYNIGLGAGIALPDNTCAVMMFKTDQLLTALLPNATNQWVLSKPTAGFVGTTTGEQGSDDNQDGGIEVPTEVFNGIVNPADCGGTGGPVVPAFRIDGQFVVTPPSTIDITPADGLTTRNADVLPAGGVLWYKITLNGPATDIDVTHFDIDTEGSAFDLSMALYDAQGNLQGNPDTDDGEATNSQLTYGVPRRPSFVSGGDGRQYDGRDGQLVAGVYYLGVAEAPVNFAGGFVATGLTGTSTGAITLRIDTNVNGTPEAPAVAPTPNFDFGVLQAGLGDSPSIAMAARDVIWYRFEVCGVSDPNGFVDISSHQVNPIVNAECAIFDAAGNFVLGDNASGNNANPQYSWGNVGPRANYSGVPTDPQFTGANGALPAGVYYMGVCHDVATFLSDRWGQRTNDNISNIPFDFFFETDNTATVCQSAPPGLCEFDINGDGNVDQGDVDCAIAAVGGDPTCVRTDVAVDLDKNEDGNVDQGDVDFIVDVVGGGTLPGPCQ